MIKSLGEHPTQAFQEKHTIKATLGLAGVLDCTQAKGIETQDIPGPGISEPTKESG